MGKLIAIRNKRRGGMRALSVGWGFSKSSPEGRVVAPFAQGSSGIAPSSL